MKLQDRCLQKIMKKQIKDYLRKLIREFEDLTGEEVEKLSYWEFQDYRAGVQNGTDVRTHDYVGELDFND